MPIEILLPNTKACLKQCNGTICINRRNIFKRLKGRVSILFQVLEAYGLTEEQKVHIVRMLRGFLQGFTAIESHGGYGNSTPLNDTFDFAVKTILNGIRDLQGEVEW